MSRMSTEEVALREKMATWARSLFERGYTVGSSGNISARLGDGFLVTPTNSCFGFLDPSRISRLDREWQHVDGDRPTKEVPLHRAFYDNREGTGAVVHLHSTHATALSCLADVDPEDAITPVTPYVVMRVGKVPVLPYVPPGSADIVPLVSARAPDHAAVLLGNHGPVVAGRDLDSAVFAAEELEETARLILITRGMPLRTLSSEQVAALEARFALK